MLAGASSWGAHVLHFFTHRPYTDTCISKKLSNTQSRKSRICLINSSAVLSALTCVIRGTEASVVVASVDAGRSVLTVVVFAVVNVGLAGGALEAQGTRATVKTSTLIKLSCQDPYEMITSFHSFQSWSSSPVFSLLILAHVAGSSVGTRVTNTGVQSCVTVLALRQRTGIMFIITINNVNTHSDGGSIV